MFFHIDESGNTGNNLFDHSQPILSYGVLSSKLNVDALSIEIHRQILKELEVNSIHANQLGVEKLTRISPLLLKLQQKIKFDFDYYFIEKQTYALVTFFDSVFDAGINPAVKWDLYWTHLRYLCIYKLSSYLNEELLLESWSLYLEKNIENHSDRIITLLKKVLDSVEKNERDARFKEVVTDVLKYGIDNPLKLDFGAGDQNSVAPNTICFQFVISAMAERLRRNRRKDALSIIVDRQTQFNPAQVRTHDLSKVMAAGLKKATPKDRKWYVNHPLHHDLDADSVLRTATPEKSIEISSSEDSIGLQICDTYLWIVNRIFSDKPISPELANVGRIFTKRSLIDSISMRGMMNRYENFEKKLPNFEDLTKEQMDATKKDIEEHRIKIDKLFK